MAFIEKADLLNYIRLADLNTITETDDAKLTNPMLDAESTIVDALSHRYNTDTIISTTDKAQFRSLRLIGVRIALFNLHNQVSPRAIPDKVDMNHELAERDLKDIREGKTGVDIYPPKTPIEEQTGIIRFSTDTFIDTKY